MKRNYTKALLSSALSAMMLATGVLAFAQSDWRPVNTNRTPGPTPEVQKPTTPFAKYRALNRIGTSDGSLAPAKDGLRPTPRISQKPRNILRSPEAPRGQMYGILNRFNGMVYNSDAFLGKIDMSTGKITKISSGMAYCPYTGSDYELQANTYRKGQIIAPYTSNEGGKWNVVDFNTGEIVETHTYTNQPYANAYSMTYDPETDRLYSVGIDDNIGKDGCFGYAAPSDPKNPWEFYPLSCLRDENCGFIANISYNPVDKQIYAFNDRNEIYTIDKNDGTPVKAGEIESDVMFFTEGYSGQVCYSPADQMFVIMYRDNLIRANRIVYLHPDTFETFDGVIVAEDLRPYFSAIFVTDDYASPDAPEIAGEPVISFEKANLSGNISFTAPEYTYIGVKLEGSDVKTIAKIDGKEVFNRNTTPGENISLDLTLEEGLHELTITSYINEEASPVRRATFYVGYDVPNAPTGITLDGNTLSWKAVPNVGAHNGYVEPTIITYDVFLNNVKQNSEPVTDTKFVLNVPEVMALSTISVVATGNGHSSEAGTIREVFGKAFNLPFFNKPTREESYLYRTINHNNDDRVFFWTDESKDSGSGDDLIEDKKDLYGWCMSVGYIDDADDWLIFPSLNFPSKDYLYSFDFDICGIFELATVESYEIYIGKKPNVKDMFDGTLIYADNYYQATTAWEHKKINFAVKEPGDYYIAIRVNSTKDNGAQGLLFNDFDIKVVDGASTVVPGDPTDVKLIPDENGTNDFEARITLPTLDITGKPLPADKKIKVTMSVTGASKEAEGLPGETISMSLSTLTNGFANILIVPSNENGEGYPRTHRVYIGIDRPLAPKDIAGTPTEDNLSFECTWKSPGSIGENGGFVDENELTYNFYTQSGVALALIESNIKETRYKFSPFTYDQRPLTRYYMGPAAVNEGGESRNSLFVMDDLGDPYELPMKEEWGSSKFNYEPYTFLSNDSFKPSYWQNVGTTAGMNVGDPRFVEGGLIGYSTAGACDAEIILPKATTKGVARVDFMVRYWDYKDGPKSIEVYGRRHGADEEVLIESIPLKREGNGEWIDGLVHLPKEFCDCSWIQMRVGAHIEGGEFEYIILDNFQIVPDVDYDLKLMSLEGSTQISIGDTPTYNVEVANAGRERMGGKLLLECLDPEQNVLASEEAEIPQLVTNARFEYSTTFDINGAFRNFDKIAVRATVTADNDENLTNNAKTLYPEIKGSQLPVVSDLKGGINGTDVELSWSVPNTEYGNYENFETLEPFKVTDKIGQFGNLDADGLKPVGIQSSATGGNLSWEGSDQPQAWTVVNMEDLKLMNDERIAPHSGKQQLMARSSESGEQSSKWLISPLVKEQTQVSFWLSTLATDLTEYFELWVTRTNTNFDHANATKTRNGSWSREKGWSKSGSETWDYFTWELPRRTKNFAVRYDTYDGLAVVLDDISFTPEEMCNRDIAHYAIFRSDNGGDAKLVADNITGTSYVDKTWADSKANYYVVTYANVDGRLLAGPKSNIVFINGSGVDDINAAKAIVGLNGKIRIDNFDGEDFSIATVDGKVVKSGKVASAQAYYAVEKGIYVVSAGKTTVKVVVK